MIPQSQEVKQFIREPSYSTILQLQREGSSSTAATAIPASRAATAVRVATPTAVPPPPIYANYSALSSTYSEGLKSSDSQGSGEEEILGIVAAARSATAGSIYNSPPSPVSSSYSELRQATKYPPGNSIIHPFRNVVKSTSCPPLPLSKVIICNSICNNKGNRQRFRAVEEVAEPPSTSLFTSPFRIQPPVLPIISTTLSSNSSTRAPRAAGGRRPPTPTLRGRRVGNRRRVSVGAWARAADLRSPSRATTSASAPNAASASWARAAGARRWAGCTTWRASRARTVTASSKASRSTPSMGSPTARQTT